MLPITHYIHVQNKCNNSNIVALTPKHYENKIVLPANLKLTKVTSTGHKKKELKNKFNTNKLLYQLITNKTCMDNNKKLPGKGRFFHMNSLSYPGGENKRILSAIELWSR